MPLRTVSSVRWKGRSAGRIITAFCLFIERDNGGTGEAALRVRALAFAGDHGSTDSIHVVVHNHISLQFQEIHHILLVFTGTVCIWYMDIDEVKTPKHKIKIKKQGIMAEMSLFSLKMSGPKLKQTKTDGGKHL